MLIWLWPKRAAYNIYEPFFSISHKIITTNHSKILLISSLIFFINQIPFYALLHLIKGRSLLVFYKTLEISFFELPFSKDGLRRTRTNRYGNLRRPSQPISNKGHNFNDELSDYKRFLRTNFWINQGPLKRNIKNSRIMLISCQPRRNFIIHWTVRKQRP